MKPRAPSFHDESDALFLDAEEVEQSSEGSLVPARSDGWGAGLLAARTTGRTAWSRSPRRLAESKGGSCCASCPCGRPRAHWRKHWD